MQTSVSSISRPDYDLNEIFQSKPLWVRSPGRINIIGEHTDYNNGFVLPAAIDKSARVVVGKRNDGIIHLFSAQYKEDFQFSIDALKPVGGWPDYVLGAIQQLILRGYEIPGLNLLLTADVPIGAGLSSSAAVECATVYAVNELFELQLSRMEMVKIAQQAEHEFTGVQCGIMDQFASMFGKKDRAIKLDCATLEYEYIPLQMEGLKIVLLNSNVSHSLASSEYNTRRAQCEKGVSIVRKEFPKVNSMRDMTFGMLDQCTGRMEPIIYRRCRYVIEENQRLATACAHLQNGNMKALGEQMFLSHDGLSRDYEVSCRELDILVDAVRNNSAVLGARMMGGGFGGCTINLVKEEAIDNLIDTLSKQYRESTGLDLKGYVVSIEDGTGMIGL